METISSAAARRSQLAAQGFAGRGFPGPGFAARRVAAQPSRQRLLRLLGRIRLLQLDSVNVAVRAHYMPPFSRLGAYRPELLDDAAWSPHRGGSRPLVEYWAHEACLLPVADWPLLGWRMRRFERRQSPRLRRILRHSPGLDAAVLDAIKADGPMGAGAVERHLGMAAARRASSRGGWWNRSDTKRVCEWLFAIGALTTATRRGFERVYDLPERVLPREVYQAAQPAEQDAVRTLLEASAAALGVATYSDLRDYYRLSPEHTKRGIAELVEAGTLQPVRVTGWDAPAYRHHAARVPRRVTGRALLSPFDPLIWDRARTERVFGFRYRIEIYVPAARRVYGYYVFPFLLDGKLVARVDLKADRQADVLRVRGAFAEPGADVGLVADELAGTLRELAGWQGLGGIVIEERGDLTGPLAAALR